MAEAKPLAPSASKAVMAVLKQQKHPHWDGAAHRYAIAYLAEQFVSEGKLDRASLASALDSEPWTFSSNMKKRLESLGLIPTTQAVEAEYQ